MIIAIQPGLENLAQELKNRGIEVVDYKDADTGVDAMIYSGTHMPSITSSSMSDSQGVFLINAYGKTADEVLWMLKNRTYSPLF